MSVHKAGDFFPLCFMVGICDMYDPHHCFMQRLLQMPWFSTCCSTLQPWLDNAPQRNMHGANIQYRTSSKSNGMPKNAFEAGVAIHQNKNDHRRNITRPSAARTQSSTFNDLQRLHHDHANGEQPRNPKMQFQYAAKRPWRATQNVSAAVSTVNMYERRTGNIRPQGGLGGPRSQEGCCATWVVISSGSCGTLF